MREVLRVALRWLIALCFIAAGVNHFLKPGMYRQIVPPMFPTPAALVAISGVAEIVGGLGLLIRPLRRAAGWGLILLLIAVFPANVYMAVSHDRIPGWNVPPLLLWLRLPLQAVLIVWVWWVSLAPSRDARR